MVRRILIIRNVLRVWRRSGRVIGGIGGGRVRRRREVGREVDGMGWDGMMMMNLRVCSVHHRLEVLYSVSDEVDLLSFRFIVCPFALLLLLQQ